MADNAEFEKLLNRLQEIADTAKKETTGLDESMELLEEGIKLANSCTEMVDSTSWIEGNEGETGDDDPLPREP